MRFYVGLDTPEPGLEFQQLDCAPRETRGDGKITITASVQIGRFATGMDNPKRAAGRTEVIFKSNYSYYSKYGD